MFNNNKKGIVWIPLLIIIAVIGLFIILAQVGEICMFGRCFHVISQQFKYEVNFWIYVIIWIVIQIAFVFAYFQLGKYAVKWFKFAKDKYKVMFEFAKQIFGSN